MARTYSVSRTIKASPERVWALLTDLDGYRTWNRAVVSIEGRIAPGETVSLVSIVAPGRTFRLTVTEVDPPRRMVWTDGMPLGLFRGTRTYTVAPMGADGAQFSMQEAFTGPMAPLITRAIPDMTESFELWADGLAAAAEQNGPGAQTSASA